MLLHFANPNQFMIFTEDNFNAHKAKYPDFEKDRVWEFYRVRKGAYHHLTSVAAINRKFKAHRSGSRLASND
jgi:hypothetical protein